MKKSLTRHISLPVLVGIVAVLFALTLVACSVTKQEIKHEHSYSKWLTTKYATCAEAGEKKKTCSTCGDIVTETIPALGHVEVVDEAIEPTCTETGLTEGKHCSRCGEVLVAQDVVPALGHTFEDGVCTRCGTTEQDDIEPTEGLSYTLNADGESYSVTGIGTATDLGIVIPSKYNELPVTSIRESAFDGCTGLTSVTIPNSVTSIGIGAFQYCIDLTTINYTGDIAGWCSISGLDNLMAYGSSTKSLYINGALVEGDLVIPNSVTTIPAYAFYNCSGLTSVTIPDSVTSIGEGAFQYCIDLTTINYTGDIAGWCSISGLDNLMAYGSSTKSLYINGALVEGDLVIPNSVTTIPAYAFYNCSGLTSVTIPDSVTSIGEGAFSGCSGLTSITIPNSVTTIPAYAFVICTGLTSVTIPDSVTSIGERAFYGCTGLTSVTIPDSVTSIGDYAFANCSGLTSVTIPDSVTSIGGRAFYNCTCLTDINYSGTKSQWNEVSKGGNWNANTGNYTIHCTDGDIAKE